jgi:transcriptional regulator with XRE-family HTH domain
LNEYIWHHLDISQIVYSKIEKNETKLSVERLYKIAEILETSVASILVISPSNIYTQNNNNDNATVIVH